MKIKVGKKTCDTKGCNTTVTVRKNEKGTLSYRCDECDASPYAPVGTGYHQAWLDEMGVSEKPEAAPEVPENPAPEEKPAHSKKPNIWGI